MAMTKTEIRVRQSIVDNISKIVEHRESNRKPNAVTEAIRQIGVGIATGRY